MYKPSNIQMKIEETSDLSGQLLIAMPGMGDPRFEHSVVYMCAHSDEGAMGLIVNKPVADLEFDDLLLQLGIERETGDNGVDIHFGGPVENGRGFVLHSLDYGDNTSTLEVDGGVGMTATLDILEDISNGEGPASCLLALGYSGWGPGQLEGELQANGWLTCAATSEIVFDLENDAKWEAAIRSLGVDPIMLSTTGGSA